MERKKDGTKANLFTRMYGHKVSQEIKLEELLILILKPCEGDTDSTLQIAQMCQFGV